MFETQTLFYRSKMHMLLFLVFYWEQKFVAIVNSGMIYPETVADSHE